MKPLIFLKNKFAANCLAIAFLMCCGCTQYMKNIPPHKAICGMWVIDRSKTTWKELNRFLKNDVGKTQPGYLKIEANGKFTIKDMPNFWSFPCPAEPLQCCSGEWWTSTNLSDQTACLWLDVKNVNGKKIDSEESAHIYFMQEGNMIYLSVIILDPDSDDILVLKKH